jgi:tight adherence protein C
MSSLLIGFIPIGVFLFTLLLAIAAWMGRDTEAPVEAPPEPTQLSAVRQDSAPRRLTATLYKLAQPSTPDERDSARSWLAQAGFQDRFALERFVATRVVMLAVMPVLAFFAIRQGTDYKSFYVAVAAAGGYYLPQIYVSSKRDARRDEMNRAVPDMLDMLVSCLEAGLGTDAALSHITRELQRSSPILAYELQTANAAVSAGVPRVEALRQMDQRTGIEAITALVAVLGQAERFGSGIAPSVRAHAELSRKKRVLDAEQRAAEVSPQLTVVMIVFILPALFVVLIGPAALQVMTRILCR